MNPHKQQPPWRNESRKHRYVLPTWHKELKLYMLESKLINRNKWVASFPPFEWAFYYCWSNKLINKLSFVHRSPKKKLYSSILVLLFHCSYVIIYYITIQLISIITYFSSLIFHRTKMRTNLFKINARATS
jgi:hypothetical protein